jgi:hypothetical protein
MNNNTLSEMGSIQNRSDTEVSYPSGAGQEEYS